MDTTWISVGPYKIIGYEVHFHLYDNFYELRTKLSQSACSKTKQIQRMQFDLTKQILVTINDLPNQLRRIQKKNKLEEATQVNQ